MALAASVALAENGSDRPLVFGVNRVGDPWILFGPPDYDEHLYQRIREAGGTCVRLAASPRDIEPKRGQRDWSEFDRDLELAIQYEQEPIVCIVNTPGWASETGEPTHLYPYKTELLPEFADFCTELARRTKGKVTRFQLWNEQNGMSWHFHDGFNHADEYLPVLKVCHDALKKGNPNCVLSLGSLDDAEGNGPIFIRKTYEEIEKQGVKGPLFDVISTHPYSKSPDVMRSKIDKMKELLAAQGDGEKPFWITEYGWNTGDVKESEQAKRLAATLEAFIQPDWKDLEVAVYLSIADFEGRTNGYGLTDANLRPKPAYFAFQGAERFGAFPPYHIEVVPRPENKLDIRWQTLGATKGEAIVETLEGQKATPIQAGDRPHTDKSTDAVATVGDLQPGTMYRCRITTTTKTAQGDKSYHAAPFTFRYPDAQVHNGDFEQGFFAGIGHGWTITGENLCTDVSLMPLTRVPRGEHAQAVYSIGKKKHPPIDSTLSTLVLCEPDQPVRFTWEWAGRAGSPDAKVLARAGLGQSGTHDPDNDEIQWREWEELRPFSKRGEIEGDTGSTLARLYIQCKSEGDISEGTAAFILDEVRVAAPAGQAGG